MTVTRQTIVETGCYLDNHRGHYISRDAVQLAQGYGFIVGSFEQWALDTYEDHSHEQGYPAESIIELAGEALVWLNAGVDRINGQNFPPIIPDGFAWDWNDGDFGLYPNSAVMERMEEIMDETGADEDDALARALYEHNHNLI